LVTSKPGPCILVSRNPHFRPEYKAGFHFVEMVKEREDRDYVYAWGLVYFTFLDRRKGEDTWEHSC
jgi:hypothetical protein